MTTQRADHLGVEHDPNDPEDMKLTTPKPKDGFKLTVDKPKP